MRKKIIQLAYALFGGALALTLLPYVWRLVGDGNFKWLDNGLVNFIIGALIFFILSIPTWQLVDQQIKRLENYLFKQSPLALLIGSLTTLIGLVLAVVITTPLQRADNFLLNAVVPVLTMLVMGYLGFRLGTTRLDEWRSILANLNTRGRRTRIRKKSADNQSDVLTDEETNYHHYKILDTNILIDGRIVDIVKTGFIEGTLLVPNFVLYELQYIADQGDDLKRVRGRRGLDMLNELRETDSVPLEMWEGDYDGIKEVDEKLIQLARDVNGILITNDYNLNKVTQFQNIEVLNINALAGALRPRVMVGQQFEVKLVKKGTERQQAVGYLDDGTMVVAEEGRNHLQEKVKVEVTSTIQTDAGRMIFARVIAD
ncbi:PIN/TRAM domain-containing protein [Weissella halotolerans]|uniref:Integral membrane protein n=1 Tax=Weissella halotolerans DSM 20190 TaxID=1123500 RepID=A0A0R2G6T2_9LACO|nr:PIN domain-containing protein [Weissella halotolerans]KRN32436.1 integral membrane protein [Weissella halotolerans DSM 20190]